MDKRGVLHTRSVTGRVRREARKQTSEEESKHVTTKHVTKKHVTTKHVFCYYTSRPFTAYNTTEGLRRREAKWSKRNRARQRLCFFCQSSLRRKRQKKKKKAFFDFQSSSLMTDRHKFQKSDETHLFLNPLLK